MTNHTKTYLLIGLLVAWGGALVLEYGRESQESDSPAVAPPPLQRSGSAPRTSQHLSLPNAQENPRERVALATPRNIFSPLNFDPPAAAKPVRTQAKRVRSRPTTTSQPTSVTPAGPSPLELATRQAQQRLAQYRFLGYLKKGGESQAFLTKGEAIFIVKQGATVEDTIQVRRIDPTVVELSARVHGFDDYVHHTIPLTKDQNHS